MSIHRKDRMEWNLLPKENSNVISYDQVLQIIKNKMRRPGLLDSYTIGWRDAILEVEKEILKKQKEAFERTLMKDTV